MDLTHTLVHLAQLKRQSSGNDGWGQPVMTTAATVSCFLHGSDARRVGKDGQTIQADYEMWVTPTTSIAINDTVAAVTTPGGDTLLTSGRVIDVQRHDHPTMGGIATRALVVRN